MTNQDPLSESSTTARQAAIKEALHVSDLSPRRRLNVQEAAAYLALSERGVYNMTSNRDLVSGRHGRRVMVDIRDLEDWISFVTRPVYKNMRRKIPTGSIYQLCYRDRAGQRGRPRRGF